MKRKYLFNFALLSLSTFFPIYGNAAYPGIYLGGQLGWSHVSDSGISRQEMGNLIRNALGDSNFTITSFNGVTDGGGLAGRVYGGYQFGCNWAVEVGWTKFNSLPVNAKASGFDLDTAFPYSASTSGTLKVDAFDLVGKAIYPWNTFFNVYGKFGFAYLRSKSNASVRVTEAPFTFVSSGNTDFANKFFPTFGLGVALDFRPDIEWDLSWSRIQRLTRSEELGSTDFLSIGLTFHFDKWGSYI